MFDKNNMLLYAVTDRAWLNGRSLCVDVEKALKGGVTCVQLREKELSDEEFLREAIQINALCKKYNIPFVINDNVDIALKCGADGVHVGQSDMEAGRVRSIAGDKMIIGVSAHNVEEAVEAERLGADYLGVGAAFATSTKKDAGNISFETIKAICEAVSIPVVAIGGISKKNMMQLKGTGVDGVALVSAVFASEDIEAECRELKALSKSMTERQNGGLR